MKYDNFSEHTEKKASIGIQSYQQLKFRILQFPLTWHRDGAVPPIGLIRNFNQQLNLQFDTENRTLSFL